MLALAGLSLTVGGCQRADDVSDERPGSVPGRAVGCNVLLITMDTTRADRLGCYGWKRAWTPALDALARRGVRFEKAFAQVPITLPSHTVLLTGTYPPENGVRDNGRDALGSELPTLAEIFRQHGYRTGAFVAAAVLDSRYGLSRGFEVYNDTMAQIKTSPRRSQIPADLVCDRALAWLQQVEAEPFLCWVHFFDPHTPHQPPREYRVKTGDDYDGEIAFMDANVGRIVAWLTSKRLLSRTLIVAVADHGESLGEHGYKWHSLLVYDSIMRVPLLFSLPGRLPENTTCRGTARIVDIMPTVLELMGWPVSPEVTGASLVAALDGQTGPTRISYGETDYPYNSFGWSKLRCLVDGRWKYIRGPRV